MQLKNWEEYSEVEKNDILTYWFYDNSNKYQIDKETKEQILWLIDGCPDFVYECVLLSRSMYGSDLFIICRAIKQNALDFLCQKMDKYYLYLEKTKKEEGKRFLQEIINSFEENVVVPNNQTYIYVTVSKPDNFMKTLGLD